MGVEERVAAQWLQAEASAEVVDLTDSPVCVDARLLRASALSVLYTRSVH